MACSVLVMVGLGWMMAVAPSDELVSSSPDTVEVRLPTGLSYEELRSVLSGLQPAGQGPRPPALPEGGTAGRDGVPEGLGGLVVDETVSKIGRDFYDVFYAAWEAPDGVRSYSVRIQEQPSPGLGTRVVLLLDDEILGQLQLQPRYEVVEELAQRAAAVVSQELSRRRPAEMPTAAGSPGSEGGG